MNRAMSHARENHTDTNCALRNTLYCSLADIARTSMLTARTSDQVIKFKLIQEK